jgi:hypothetical protein
MLSFAHRLPARQRHFGHVTARYSGRDMPKAKVGDQFINPQVGSDGTPRATVHHTVCWQIIVIKACDV